MNKNIILGSLIAGGLIGAAVIMGFVMSKPDAPQQAAIQTEATEATQEVQEAQESPSPTNQAAVPAPATPATQTAPAPASAPAPQKASIPAPIPSPVAQKVTPQKTTASASSEFCPDRAGGGPQVAFYETKNFYIYICDIDRLYYHGVSKKDSSFINLPAYTEEGTGYVAENGDYTYIVNGAALTVMQGNKVLQEENVF
ncbi:MAG: hypothetical protein WA865_17070 [Spirulinaceae cyanobacterium]